MEATEEEQKPEIIIVRRGGSDHDDEHHGGVWKIAYADFMTAMMAFFLVMWLVNVASEDAKQAMANYFNPIKMQDHAPQSRDMQDDAAAAKEHVKQEVKKEAAHNRQSAAKNRNPTFDEDATILDEPYGALETIALLDRQDGHRQEDTGTEKGGQQSPAHISAPRDPFAPPHWQEQSPIDDIVDLTPATPDQESQQDIVKQDNQPKAEEATDLIPDTKKDQEIAEQHKPDEDQEKIQPEVIAVADVVADDAENLMHEVMQGREDQEMPQMEVHVQDDGIVIELTDTQNYGMFAVGSAKPESHIIDLLEGLAKIIDQYPGEVVISGYTDARPYRNTAHYDNWQLSSARAQMAHYMLVRGGLDESRILKVEGYADRQLRNEQDSYAAENRRIAIHLKNIADKSREKSHAS